MVGPIVLEWHGAVDVKNALLVSELHEVLEVMMALLMSESPEP